MSPAASDTSSRRSRSIPNSRLGGRAWPAWGWAPVADGFERAREAAKRALALAPDLAEGHVCLGMILERGDWDLQAADVELQRAFELAPGNVDVLVARAGLALILGRHDESIELRRKAVALDPLSTT